MKKAPKAPQAKKNWAKFSRIRKPPPIGGGFLIGGAFLSGLFAEGEKISGFRSENDDFPYGNRIRAV